MQQPKMKYLMAMQIAYDSKKLTKELVCFLSVVEIVWMVCEPFCKRFSIDILH